MKFENIKKYEEYLGTLSLEDLQDVESRIDKDRYPERYSLVIQYIEKVQKDLRQAESLDNIEDSNNKKSSLGLLPILLVFIIAIEIFHRKSFGLSSESSVNLFQIIDVFLVILSALALSIISRDNLKDIKQLFWIYIVLGLLLIVQGFVIALLSHGPTIAFQRLILKDYYIVGITIPTGYSFIVGGFVILTIHKINKYFRLTNQSSGPLDSGR